MSFTSTILQTINIAILPVIIIPVSGLCCLVFYNRIAALNGTLHSIQNELRSYLRDKVLAHERKDELINILQQESHLLIKRSDLIRIAITCCFAGIISFILSAISIMLSLLWQDLSILTLCLWLIGATLFAIGLSYGIFEIRSPILRSINMENTLIDKWIQEDILTRNTPT